MPISSYTKIIVPHGSLPFAVECITCHGSMVNEATPAQKMRINHGNKLETDSAINNPGVMSYAIAYYTKGLTVKYEIWTRDAVAAGKRKLWYCNLDQI